MKKRSLYKTCTKEFKLEAVRLMKEAHKPASEIAMELGIRRNQLYTWAEQLERSGELAFKGRGHPKKEDQTELTTLKQDNERLREGILIWAMLARKNMRGEMPLTNLFRFTGGSSTCPPFFLVSIHFVLS